MANFRPEHLRRERSESNVDSTSRNRRPRLCPEAALMGRMAAGFFAILYVRSPTSFFDESIFSPPFFPRMRTEPRTVCGFVWDCKMTSVCDTLRKQFRIGSGSEEARAP